MEMSMEMSDVVQEHSAIDKRRCLGKKLGAHYNSPSFIFRVLAATKERLLRRSAYIPQGREFVYSENERAVAESLPCYFTSKGDQ